MQDATDLFTGLTPPRVLDAVEAAGLRCNPLCHPLNSYENRVYEVELDDADRTRVVAKFYRPGRWSEAQIRAEHAFMQAAREAELPLCPVRPFPDGDTLHAIDGIRYCLYPRFGGRAPEELTPGLAERLGMLVGRLHNAGAALPIGQRRALDADTFGWDCIEAMEESPLLPRDMRGPWLDAAASLARLAETRLSGVPVGLVHGDFHLGNLLLRRDAGGPAGAPDVVHVLDFDDCAVAPAVQDLWLVLPGRGPEADALLDRMIAGYRRFREFDADTTSLIEPLRGLRMIHYAAWVARRWHDPVFPRTWPQFTTSEFWRSEVDALRECLAHAEAAMRPGAPGGAAGPGAGPDEPEPTNADFFWDWEG